MNSQSPTSLTSVGCGDGSLRTSNCRRSLTYKDGMTPLQRAQPWKRPLHESPRWCLRRNRSRYQVLFACIARGINPRGHPQLLSLSANHEVRRNVESPFIYGESEGG